MSSDATTTVICWVALGWAAVRTDFRARAARLPLLTFTCITLVATFRNPAVALAVDRAVGLPDLGRLLAYLAMTGTAAFWGLFCLTLAPPDVQRRAWLLRLTKPVVAGLILLWLLEVASGQPVQDYSLRTNDLSIAVTVIAQLFLFLVVTGLGLPTMLHSVQEEIVPALRLRLAMLCSSQVFASIMTASVIALYLLVLLDILPPDFQSPFIFVLMLMTTLAYAAGLLPVRFYTRLALGIDYLRHWYHLMRIRMLERRTAELLGLSPKPFPLKEALAYPDYVTYVYVIGILDRRKTLFSSQSPPAQAIAATLDNLCTRDAQYRDVVRHLSSV